MRGSAVVSIYLSIISDRMINTDNNKQDDTLFVYLLLSDFALLAEFTCSRALISLLTGMFKTPNNQNIYLFIYLIAKSHPFCSLLNVLYEFFCFGSLVVLDVMSRYLSLFLLYINTKIGKNRC